MIQGCDSGEGCRLAASGFQAGGIWELARLPEHSPPLLVVVVDTEEQFDWRSPDFRREWTDVSALEQLPRLQRVFDEFGAIATYVVSHPVAAQREQHAALAELARAGRADIGAHLHPWVTPPFDEPLSRPNSYAGNLPAQLEAAKLRTLIDAIVAAFGARPTCYKAGRYGVGGNSARLLEEMNFEVDLSASPAMDYRDDGGPDFRRWPQGPFWFGRGRRLLALPCTGGFFGALRRFGPYWSGRLPRPLPGLLWRTGMLARARLSPEGFALDDLRRLTHALLAQGVRVLTLSLHSPSLRPGSTPYTRTEAEVSALLDTCRRYFEFFLDRVGGRPARPTELRAILE